MKREALIRELRAHARKNDIFFDVVKDAGKGSHYRVYFGHNSTTIKSGELSPTYIGLIKKQLGV